MVKYTKNQNKIQRRFVKKHSRSSSSRRITSTKPMNCQPRKTFCKVCYDCHKPPEMYLSHRPKIGYGPNAITICPTLLNTRCPKCGNLGHTGGNCRNHHQEPHQHQQQYQQHPQHHQVKKPYYTIRKYVPQSTPPSTPPSTIKPKNIFNLLNDAEDEDMYAHERGRMMSSDNLSFPKTTVTYAQIASHPIKSERDSHLNNIVQLFKKNTGIHEEKEEEKKDEKEEEKEIEFNELKHINTRSWADIMEEENDDLEIEGINVLCS